MLRRGLTGGGFGGCTVNLVAAANVEAFTEAMRAGYQEATGITPEIYTSRAFGGAPPSRCRLRAGRLS